MSESQDKVPGLLELARMLMALEADPNFELLRASQARTNMFRIVGTTDTERWHSAFWSWVLDPEGSHGLGDFAVRRLLLHAVGEDGRLRGIRLEPEVLLESEIHWKRAPVGETSYSPSLSDIATWRVARSAAAPGPLSDFSEVTSRKVPEGSQKKTGDDNRFDILLVLQGDHPDKERRRRGALLTLFLVIEMKVGAPYDSTQLVRYSRWLHQDPSAADLVSREENADLIARIGELANTAQLPDKGSETWGVGIFLSPKPPAGLPTPTALNPQWSDVRFSALVEDILEGALRHSGLDPYAKPLLQNYIDLVADPTMEILSMPPAEHRELVEGLYARHRSTFRIIAKVLASGATDPSQDTPEQVVGRALDAVEEEQEILKRARSLTPQQLIDANLAKIGDRLEHAPMKSRSLGTKPFEKLVVVELVSGARAGFRLVDGPVDIGQAPFTSTRVLQEVYSRFGSKFSANGNACLVFVSGVSKGYTLEEAYSQLRESES